MLDVTAMTSALEHRPDGIWFARSRARISHPEQYQEWYRAVEDESYWYRHRAECIVDCLRKYPPAGPIVDVGGGNGHVSAAMQRAGFAPVLVEPSPQAARNARARGIEPVICATLEDAQFQPNSVSAVGAFDVMEHIESDVSFLQTIHRLLTPGGRVYLTVPAFRFLWSSYDEYVGHVQRYTLRSLHKLMSRHGFEVDRASYLYAALPLPIFLLRSLPSLLGLSRSRNFERFRREYAPRVSLATRIMESLLGLERTQLRRGRSVPFGSSCLIVARAV